MSPPKGRNASTTIPPPPLTLTPSSSHDDLADDPQPSQRNPRALIASIRGIISAARAGKKHPTVDGYAKIFASLDLLEAVLNDGDHIAVTLSSFKVDLIAELVAATARLPATSYASAAAATPRSAPPPPKSLPAAKPNELVVSMKS